jgi:hypothetical protein
VVGMDMIIDRSLMCLSFVFLLLTAHLAAAQPVGVFSWQLQPYCNVVTLHATFTAGHYALQGYDNQCGGATSASATGVAFPNPNGTMGIGLTIVASGGNPTHVNVTIDPNTLNGSWVDSAGATGSFVMNGAAGGTPRPTNARVAHLELPTVVPTLPELQLTGIGLTPDILSVRAGGSPAGGPAATLNGDLMFTLGAAGHTGTTFTAPRAAIEIHAAENWAPSANGTTIRFRTTNVGSTILSTRMIVRPDGNVGIGTLTPANLLDVNGDIRIGAGATGCVLDSDGTAIAGTCSSDLRLKRDSRVFAAMLDKVAGLQPVTFKWRAAEFPERGFGSRESYGLIAQEVEAVLPDLVVTGEDGFKAVNYSKLSLLAIQAIKELKEKNDALERRLAALEAALKQ